MASVDPQDPLIHPVKLGNPAMKDDIRRLKLLISILRPLLIFLLEWAEWHIENQELQVRVKQMDDAVLKVIGKFQQPTNSSPTDVLGDDDWESSPTNTQLVVSCLSYLSSLDQEIYEICNLCINNVSRSIVTSKSVEHVVSFINHLLQKLKDIAMCRVNTIIPVKKEIEDIKERLIFLRYFLWLVAKLIEQDDRKDVLNSAQTLAVQISYLLYLCFNKDKIDDEIVSVIKEVRHPCLVNLIDILQMNVNFIYYEYWVSLEAVPDDTPTVDEQVLACTDCLIHKLRQLSENEAPCFVVAVKDLTDILIDELSFLRCNLMDLLLQNPIKQMELLTTSTHAIILQIRLFIYKSRDTEEDEQIAEYCSSKLPDLLKAIDNLYQEASDLFNKFFNKFFSKSWQSNFPSTNVLEYANFLVNKLEELLRSKAAPLNALKHQTETVYGEIVSMRKLLCDSAQQGNSQMKFLLTRYKDAAQQAECVIDSFVAGKGSIWCHKLGLFVVTKDVKILQKEVKAILTITMTCDAIIPSVFSGASSQANNPPSLNVTVGSKYENIHNRAEDAADQLVGMQDAEAETIELLTGGSRQLMILSIVGMPGLGKTTLANSVYKHPSITLYFHVRAWCCVSQVYQKETLLFAILGQIVGEANQCHEINRENAAQKLYQNLKGRKYLIVMDDIWDINAWNDLKECFPDDNNGSRILFTTRNRAVASRQANSIQYALRQFSLEESCKLLWLKLSDGETCPPELSTISTCIARNCEGLPLAVVLIAGILKWTERKKDCWERVAETFIRSHSTREKYFAILNFSYKHLPDCLKPCFLYLATFPEDTTISASKLIRLWICEGFVLKPNLGQKSLEQEAENYLNDLVDRSLVMITRRSSKGGVKTCRIHDVLRDFCLTKFQDERFLNHEDMFGGISILIGDPKMHIRSLLYYNRSYGDLKFKHRMNRPFRGRMVDSVSVRAVVRDKLHRGRANQSESERIGSGPNRSRQLDYGFILLLKFKLLGVLDLGNVRVESSADTSDLVKISKLVHLRYLAIRVCITEIPTEIGNLRNLETFLLSGTIGEVILPEAIWNLVSLRHILTYHSFFSFQHYSQDFFKNFSQLENLKFISTLCLSHGSYIDEFILRRLIGIRKLGCKFSNSWDDSTGCNLFPVLDFLSELESLKVFFSCKALYPCKFSFPSNLKKLVVSNSRLPWDAISVIGRLPNLEVLKLLNKAFEGQQWDTRDGEFQELKFLKLDSLDIEDWNASSEHLPRLEQLVVLSCQQLKEIPSSFGEIPTLEFIEMRWCSSSATSSVQQILEEQRELSNNQLNVTVVSPC